MCYSVVPIHPLVGACLTMFLDFVGLSAAQFHSYLFEKRGFGALEIGLLGPRCRPGHVAPIPFCDFSVKRLRFRFFSRFPRIAFCLARG